MAITQDYVQGLLKDNSGSPVADGTYQVIFTIYDSETDGTSKWTETQSVNTTSGLFNVLLGSVTALSDSVFNHPSRWLGLNVGDEDIAFLIENLHNEGVK